jgi:O-antigen/teichoic acid export membrane protein
MRISSKKADSLASIIDAGMYRFGVAAVSLILGIIAAPEEFGLFASILIPVGLFQACFEGLVRGSSSRLFTNFFTRGTMNAISSKGALVGIPAVLGFALFQIWRLGLDLSTLLLVLPLVFAPYLTTLSSMTQRLIQLQGDWVLLAKVRSLVTFVVLVPCLFALFFTKSILVASVFLPLTEVLILVLLNKHVHALSPDNLVHTELIGLRREVGDFIPFQVRFWLLTQSDRLVVSLIAPAQIVGIYLISVALSRLPFEVSSSSLNAVLRNKLSADQDDSLKSKLSNQTNLNLQIFNILSLIVVGFFVFQLLPSLNPELSDVPYLVMVLMSSVFMKSASSVVWTRSIFEHGTFGKSSTQGLAILGAAAAGLLATQDLFLGCLAIAIREILTSGWILWKWKNYSSLFISSLAVALTLLAVFWSVTAYIFAN